MFVCFNSAVPMANGDLGGSGDVEVAAPAPAAQTDDGKVQLLCVVSWLPQVFNATTGYSGGYISYTTLGFIPDAAVEHMVNTVARSGVLKLYLQLICGH